jgi:hypothetical protein
MSRADDRGRGTTVLDRGAGSRFEQGSAAAGERTRS